MEIRITPTKDVHILGFDKRALERLAWCAVTSGVGRLFWIDGYLMCLEVYEKAFEYEVEKGFFPISQLCYTKLQNYISVYDVGRGTQLPVTDVSDLKLYRAILDAIKAHEKGR